MLPQELEGIVVATEIFLLGHEPMNCRVAVAAQIDRLLHLFATELLLKPLIAVTGARDQVMRGRAHLHRPPAKFAGLGFHRRLAWIDACVS